MPRRDEHRLVPLTGVCLASEVSVEHVHALVRAGVLPEPEVGPEGVVAVRSTYLDVIDPDPEPPLADDEWRLHFERELRRFRDGRTRLLNAVGAEHARRREQQLTRIASAAWGAGLSLLMARETRAARTWLSRAATLYRRSLADAEPGSWGRSIGAIKSRVLADDPRGAEREAICTLQLGASNASRIGRYAGCLGLLLLGRDGEARPLAEDLERSEGFPRATARALRALALHDHRLYEESLRAVLHSFETRERFLEDIPVADTVLVLQRLAEPRRLDVELSSPRLPPARD